MAENYLPVLHRLMLGRSHTLEIPSLTPEWVPDTRASTPLMKVSISCRKSNLDT